MEFIIISIVSVVFLIILKLVFDINIKKIKEIGKNSKLDEVTKTLPDNIAICKKILTKLQNDDVKIEENKEGQTSLYIAISNKIIIANLKDSYTRIQTIAHECLHSIQNRKTLLFNFIFSNIYLIYFFSISILAIFKILPYKMLFLNIFIICGLVYYMVRVYLENDAMIKAKYLAKEYMEEDKTLNTEQIDEITCEYDRLNNMGIKCVNYNLFFGIMCKIIIFSIICFIR